MGYIQKIVERYTENLSARSGERATAMKEGMYAAAACQYEPPSKMKMETNRWLLAMASQPNELRRVLGQVQGPGQVVTNAAAKLNKKLNNGSTEGPSIHFSLHILRKCIYVIFLSVILQTSRTDELRSFLFTFLT